MDRNTPSKLNEGLAAVDFSVADVSQIERGIYKALLKAKKQYTSYISPIAPYSEAADLDALVGDQIMSVRDSLAFSADRLNSLYSGLNELNNTFKAELDSLDSLVTSASVAINGLNRQAVAVKSQYCWVSDSFNSSLFVDKPKTTALVDTDYGMLSLNLQSFEDVTSYELSVDKTGTVGLPGCNLMILDIPFMGTDKKEPEVSLESNNTLSLGNIVDNDSSTWFEIERNFIPQNQKMQMLAQANVYSAAGTLKDVKAVTKDLDWKVFVQWGNNPVDQGPDNNGYSLAEFIDLEKELTAGVDPKKYAVRLTFNAVLKTPQPLTAIKMIPFIRGSQSVHIESLNVLIDDGWLEIIKDVDLGTDKSTSTIQQNNVKNTGITSSGSIYFIPTDKDIKQITVVMYSNPEKVKLGFAHAFRDFYHKQRSERNHGLWKTVDTWHEWKREPIDKTPPTLVSSVKNAGKVSGTAAPTPVSTAPSGGSGGGINPVSLAQGTQLVQAGLKAVGLGPAAMWLGKAVPVIGGVLLVADLVSKLFTYSHTDTIEDARQAYDIFTGYRAALGIRGFSLLRAKYNSSATFYSLKRDFGQPVSRVGIVVDETIPEGWGAGDWVKYYGSVDGTTWFVLPKLTVSTLDQGKVLDTPVSGMYVKIELRGNVNDVYRTPTVQNYALEGMPVS